MSNMSPYLETKGGGIPVPFLCQTLPSGWAKDFSNFIKSRANVIYFICI